MPGGKKEFWYSILFFDLHDLFQQILTWDALNSSNRPEQLFHPRIPSSVPPEILDWYKKFSLSLSGVSKITTFTFCEIESFHYSGCKGLIASTSSSCRSSGEWRKRAGGCDSWYNSLDYLTIGFVNILIELLSHSLTDSSVVSKIGLMKIESKVYRGKEVDKVRWYSTQKWEQMITNRLVKLFNWHSDYNQTGLNLWWIPTMATYCAGEGTREGRGMQRKGAILPTRRFR